ncbi:MAG: hypothetical protein DHS20C05_24000 [Hyphococcus sp.]|nr:MAG: hypothetical protein DHS20C05_24000 [Marinicaulis sp.]
MPDLLEFGGWALSDLLSEPLRAQLSSVANHVRYHDGKLIHSRGEVKPGLSIIQTGAVRFANPGIDGAYATTSTLGAGHCFGEATLFARLPRTYDAIAVGDTVIEQITKPKFDRLFVAEPELARALLISTTRRLYGALEFLDDLRNLPLDVRTAKLLASMLAASRKEGVVQCTQTDLAFTLGVTRVSVGTALRKLQKEGILTLHYGRIKTPDKNKLYAWLEKRSALIPR